LSVSAQVLGRELERLRLAQLWIDGWLSSSEPDWRLNVHDVFHHAGTTRMAGNPSEGVTDEHCRVHGIGNLYVAGSSVFPTAGHANPTLTILALALRLAERLASGRG
jgi:choline dehydrogenase-like flavoprotein